MTKRKHDRGICNTWGCHNKGIIAVFPNDISNYQEAGAFYVERWHFWSKPQREWYMLRCQECWDIELAPIVARGENLFSYEVLE